MHRTGLTLVSAMDYHLPETPTTLLDSSFTSLPPSMSLYHHLLPSPSLHQNTSQTEPTSHLSFEYPFPMALTRLALKNLQQRALVSSPADALLPRQTEALIRRLCDQSSEGNPKEVAVKNEDRNPKIVTKREGKKWVPWRKNGGEFHLGNSLMQAAENINRVLKSLNLSRPWWVSGGRVKEQEDWYKLRVEMPGISKEEVKVTVEGRILSIRGEHREEEEEEEEFAESYGYYESTVMLPEDAVADEIKAELKDGVLTITIPRTEKPPKDVKEINVV